MKYVIKIVQDRKQIEWIVTDLTMQGKLKLKWMGEASWFRLQTSRNTHEFEKLYIYEWSKKQGDCWKSLWGEVIFHKILRVGNQIAILVKDGKPIL